MTFEGARKSTVVLREQCEKQGVYECVYVYVFAHVCVCVCVLVSYFIFLLGSVCYTGCCCSSVWGQAVTGTSWPVEAGQE